MQEITFDRLVIRSGDIDRKFGSEKTDFLYHIRKKCCFPLNFICAFESEQLLADKGKFAPLHVLKGYFLTQAGCTAIDKKVCLPCES
jgi:hypothetical protein